MEAVASTLPRAQETLTAVAAYGAMLQFLEAYWERGGKQSDDLAMLLSNVTFGSCADGATADPAQWYDWLNAIDRTK